MRGVNEDIVEHILDSYDHWWPRDFCRLALISSVWLQPVRKRLYAFPTLGSYHSCHYLAQTLDTNPAIITLVRALDIHPTGDALWQREDLNEHVAGFCPGVPRLLALTRLQRLVLGGDLANSPERFLRAVASPHTIKTLQIVCTNSRERCIAPEVSFNWDGELALRFHALESLSLDGPLVLDIDDIHYNPDASTDCADSSPRGCMLKELHLRGIEVAEGSGSICALLHDPASWRQLRALTFAVQSYTKNDMEDFASLLVRVHSSLEHLSFRSSTRVGAFLINDLLECVEHVPALFCLRSLETSYELVHEGFGPVFADVESLDIVGAFSASQPLEWATYIEMHGYPRLKKLSLRLHESPTRRLSQSHVVFEALAGACKRRGIKFDKVY